VVVAQGGAAGASASVNSSNGAGGSATGTLIGTTTFLGGAGGTGNFTSGAQGSGAGGGAAGPTSAGGAATVNVAGAAGTGTFLNGVVYQKAGAAGVGDSTVGNNGTAYGAGGSGGKANANADKAGGSGAQGIAVLTWDTPPSDGTFVRTLAAATMVATAVAMLPVSATLDRTLAAATLTSVSLAANPGVLVRTLAPATLAATVAITDVPTSDGVLIRTVSPATLSAAAGASSAAVLVRTVAPVTLAASASSATSAVLVQTLAPATVFANSIPERLADLARTVAPATLDAAALAHTGVTLTRVLSPATVSAAALAEASGVLDRTLHAATQASTARLSVRADALSTILPATLTATSTAPMYRYPSQSLVGNRLRAFRLAYIASGLHAWLDARSGIARSGASRSNYYKKQNVVLTIGGNNMSAFIRFGTLSIRQAINDEPDTASFTLTPDAPFAPHVGDVVSIGLGAASNMEFAGRVMTVQHRREPGRRKPFFNLLCHDWLGDFDARLVSYAWPKQSATTTILDLIARYCQHNAGVQFGTTAVVSNLPELAAFSVVNARPSEVMRRVTSLLDGGFYIEADRNVHAWAGTYAPGFTDPKTLDLDLFTLKAFAHTDEGSQARTMLVVEGQRTEALAGLPDTPGGFIDIGIPVGDATPWRQTTLPVEARIGSQRVRFEGRVAPPFDPTKQHSTTIVSVQNNGTYFSWQVADPSVLNVHGDQAWLRMGDIYIYYGWDGQNGYTSPTGWGTPPGWGAMPQVPVVGATVTIVDYVMGVAGTSVFVGGGTTRAPIQSQPSGTEIVLVYRQGTTRADPWPPANLEHLVSDGRYSYAGAAERADTELSNFERVDVSAQWLTDDPNARPGRRQRVALAEPDPLSDSFLILASELTFPGANLPPRRQCTGGTVKKSNILDILLTAKD
jgi:hypothetical protein